MAAGTLDKTFGTNSGWTATAFYPDEDSYGNSQVIDSVGRIVVTGYTKNKISGLSRLLLARYTSSGILDTSFGEDGGFTVTSFYPGKFSEGSSLAIDSSGRILVTGLTDDNSSIRRLFVARYTSNGILDTSFGEEGGFTATIFYPEFQSSQGNSLVIDSSSRIVVTGNTYDNSGVRRLLVARYTTNGILDTNFGEEGGFTATEFYPGKDSYGEMLAIDSSGRIVVIGNTADNSDVFRLLVARYTSSGVLDTIFGEDGGWTIGSFYSGKRSYGYGLAIDSSGNIVITGYTFNDSDVFNLLVARYTSFGKLDNNFGEEGGWTATIFDIYISTFELLDFNIVLDRSERIVFVGQVNVNYSIELLLVRYTSNGILDTSFGDTGKGWTVSSFYPDKASQGFGLGIDSNGNIVVTGFTYDTSGIARLLVARYIGIEQPTTTTTTTEPICVPAGTPILTDQGLVAIEQIQPAKHTINKQRIVAITKTVTPEKVLVVFEANSMGINCPSKRTTMTPGHEVLYKGKLVQAKNFVGRLEGVHNVPYTGEVLYNVLMEKHGLMRVNNMVLETLHPQNKVAKEILGKLGL